MIELIEFHTFRQFYTEGQIITSDCNSITFLNGGTNTMLIDGVPFAPSQSIVFNGNVGEITRQEFTLSFSGVGNSNCIVYRKTYVDGNY